MSQIPNDQTVMTEEDRAQAHREAQQRYYRRKKNECEFYSQELERLRNQVSYLTGQLNERDNSRSQLQSQLNEKNNLISQLQQQVSERNVTVTQLQTLLSRCDNQEENRRIGELVQALTGEIQRGQQCLQIINQLNSEKEQLNSEKEQMRIYKNILVELNDKYPKLLPSFVYELQFSGNAASLPEINNWAREQLSRIGQNEVRSLSNFK
jgi:chromosome segregation ATPase